KFRLTSVEPNQAPMARRPVPIPSNPSTVALVSPPLTATEPLRDTEECERARIDQHMFGGPPLPRTPWRYRIEIVYQPRDRRHQTTDQPRDPQPLRHPAELPA